jgi:hypothetical protein
MNGEFLGDRRRANEEEYIHRHDQALIESARQRRRQQTDRQRLADLINCDTPETLQALESLGYTPDTVVLLDVVPLLYVAVVDAAISPRERARIIDAARTYGIQPGTPADERLSAWLTLPPSDDFLEHSLHVLGDILCAQPRETRAARQGRLLQTSRDIASISGGVLGFGTVSMEEQEILELIEEEFGRCTT